MASAETFYRIKRIDFLGRLGVPIFLQNLNGPCPLLSISNILSLRNQLPPDVVAEHASEVSTERLLAVVADRILNASADMGSSQDANLRANIHDCLEVLNKLGTGIDVNVRFNSATGFEFTKETAIFDLLHIPLVHGWLVDPQARETARILGPKTYNQAVELMIAGLDLAPAVTVPNAQQAPTAQQAFQPQAPAPTETPSDDADLLGLGDGPAAVVPLATESTVAVPSANQDLIAALDSLVDGLSAANSMPVTQVDENAVHLDAAPDAPSASAPAAIAVGGIGQPMGARQPDGAEAAAVAAVPPAVPLAVPLPVPPALPLAVHDNVAADAALQASAAGAALETTAVMIPASEAPAAATALETPTSTSAPAQQHMPQTTATPDGHNMVCTANPSAGLQTSQQDMAPVQDTAAALGDDVQLFQGLSIIDAAVAAPGIAVDTAGTTTAEGSAGLPKQHLVTDGQADSMPHAAATETDVRSQDTQQQAPVMGGTTNGGMLISSQSVARRSHEALVVKEFLDSHASQLTVYGITQIAASLNENALAVFFRNNHFNCLFKKDRSLFLLVTDQGYLGVPEVTWERLDTVDGDTQLCGPDFLPYKPVQQSPTPTRIDMEALAAIPPEALAGLSEADAAAVAEAAGLLVPVAKSPQPTKKKHGGSSMRASDNGAANSSTWQPQQRHSLAGDAHDADLALAIQLQEEEHEAAKQRDAFRAQQQQQQHGQPRQQQQYRQGQQYGQYSSEASRPGTRTRPPPPQQPSMGVPASHASRPTLAPAPPKKDESSCSIM